MNEQSFCKLQYGFNSLFKDKRIKPVEKLILSVYVYNFVGKYIFE